MRAVSSMALAAVMSVSCGGPATSANTPVRSGPARGSQGEPLHADVDGDGVRGRDDACPRTPEDVDTFADRDGCADVDDDGDGVIDLADDCPLEPGDAAARGCPPRLSQAGGPATGPPSP